MNTIHSENVAYIGVDVGGTKIKTGAVGQDGAILCEPVTVTTSGNEDSENILARITGSIESVMNNPRLKSLQLKGIGMGVTGPLDTEKGIILECPQLPTMHFYPLKEKIREKFQLPVYMDNDANALLLGESVWGAGRGSRAVLGFTLGTGLGCAIVVDKKLFRGANGLAGEIWPSPNNGGTIEDIVSGNGVSKTFQRLSDRWETAEKIAQLAYNGDLMAVETWNIFGEALAVSLAWGINLIDPDIVILGGSIANSMDLFYKSMTDYLKRYICPVPAAKTRVVKAALGDNSGFIGAAALIIQDS